MSSTDERNVDPIEEMIHIAQNILGSASRRFTESYRSTQSKKVIYDSEWCRISFTWGGWDYGSGNNILIHYGRLHAPNEKSTMIWNGEECYCWHDFDYALHFLDGRLPAEAVELNYSHPVTNPFYEDEFRKKFHRRQPEWLAQIHLTIWQHYGNRLFELFDLRRPELWQQYQQFLKEVYDNEGRIPAIKPAMDKVC